MLDVLAKSLLLYKLKQVIITRLIKSGIEKLLFLGKAIIIYGPRQTGKTTLLKFLKESTTKKVKYLNCDEPDIRNQLTDKTSSELRVLIGDAKIVLIDEAQRIKNIGLTLKLIIDQIIDVQLIVTGSSAFELANRINEPLTGRKFDFLLLPFSTEELVNHHGELEERRHLEHRLVYGAYPDIVVNPGQANILLNNLVNSYLFNDIFAFQDVRKPEIIEKLLEALALQLGSEVSINELSKLLQIDRETVMRYLDLLEKTFVIFRLPSLSRNLRNEIKKNKKVFFYDNGVRNAIISNFNNIDSRSDVGALWENYIISEKIKYQHYNSLFYKNFFWRTKQQQEIDFIEDYGGIIHAFEIKWNPMKEVRFSKTFKNAYPNHELTVVTPSNYLEVLCK